jgi:excisionase family DNA binding protein
MDYATMDGVKERFGFSRSFTYNLISEGKIRAVKVGGRTLVDVAATKAWLDSLPAAATNCPRPKPFG